jgi:hypothetical protein
MVVDTCTSPALAADTMICATWPHALRHVHSLAAVLTAAWRLRVYPQQHRGRIGGGTQFLSRTWCWVDASWTCLQITQQGRK